MEKKMDELNKYSGRAEGGVTVKKIKMEKC